MVKKEVEIKGKKIYYRLYGEGQPVVLVHGFGEDGEVWRNQVEFLKNKFRLIVPDLPGSGRSPMIDDMSMEGLAEVIKYIIDRERNEASHFEKSEEKNALRKEILVGHSMGGYVSLAFAEKYPHYLKALGLFQSTAFSDSDEKKITRKKGIEFINEFGAFEFLKNTTPNLFSPYTKEKKPLLVENQVSSLSNSSAAALVSYYEAMIRRPDRTSVLRNSTIPVLFIGGRYDTAVPMEDLLKQCFLPSLSYIHMLDKSGHMGMLEEPSKCNLILEKFLKESVLLPEPA